MVMLEQIEKKTDIIARDVTFDNYMKYFAQDFAEWEEGMVIKLPPVTEEHDSLFRFLIRLLDAFLDETKLGVLRVAPFVMKITAISPAREPDLQIVLKERANNLQRTMMAGPADVVIEIVSKDSEKRDKEEKFAEYQVGGVREYWIFDPLKRESSFYFLNPQGKFEPFTLKEGSFHSRVLTRFQLDTLILWQVPLPTGKQIAAMVEHMLKADN